MQENQRARLSLVQSGLPWAVAAVGLLLYAFTLNRWVTLDSLPFVAKVTGWDWSIPYQNPLFFLLTFPIRWFPVSWQPVLLNLFSAVCAALSLALLARSVALLPHDRTHEQRQRERSEFSLLSIPLAWVPPILAALVCGLELTFWEHSTAATNESLDLLLFAYVVRCLLEFRISQRESWLLRMSLVYGLGVTNNAAMIGFFPCVLVAVLWIKGKSFFNFGFFLRMFGCGLLGLSLYLLLPAAWAFSGDHAVTFWQALRANLVGQKSALLDLPGLRNRVLILSLTSVLPLIIIGLRWPASFGDTSAAGAALSSVMFRVIHTAFLAACIWVAFDQQFSPRTLGAGRVPFLTFYYLGALSIGYFSGYLLLVSGPSRSKVRHRPSVIQIVLNRVLTAAVLVALVAVPAALVWQNWRTIRTTNGPLLHQMAEASAQAVPDGSIVMSDDPYSVLLVGAGLSERGALAKDIVVHTRSLLNPEYHDQLHRRYGNRWPNFFTNQPPDELIDDGSLLVLLTALNRTNSIYYLHPSFGYYFETFYLEPHGLVYEFKPYTTNSFFPPALSAATLAENNKAWSQLDPALQTIIHDTPLDSRDVHYLGSYYSRAANYWGAMLQRNEKKEEAGKFFKTALDLNTNNVPAQCNLEFNRSLCTGQPHVPETTKSIEERFGLYPRGWDAMLLTDGPFDQPEFCSWLGQIFERQGLYRESAIQWKRVETLDKTNAMPRLALADVFLSANLPQLALDQITQFRAAHFTNLPPEAEVELARLEGVAQFNLKHPGEGEKILNAAFEKYPKFPGVLDPLLLYTPVDQFDKSLAIARKIIQADPDRARSFINEAALYLRNSDPTNALTSIDQILKRFPNQPDALLYKIYILLQTKRYPEAKVEIDRLLNVEPENVEGLLNQAVVNIQTTNYTAALVPLRRVLRRQPNNATALRYRAFTYLQQGDLSNARKDYNTLRRLATRDFVYVAYWGLGEIAFRQKDAATARRYYALYLDHAPTQESPELKDEKKIVTERLKSLNDSGR